MITYCEIETKCMGELWKFIREKGKDNWELVQIFEKQVSEFSEVVTRYIQKTICIAILLKRDQ